MGDASKKEGPPAPIVNGSGSESQIVEQAEGSSLIEEVIHLPTADKQKEMKAKMEAFTKADPSEARFNVDEVIEELMSVKFKNPGSLVLLPRPKINHIIEKSIEII